MHHCRGAVSNALTGAADAHLARHGVADSHSPHQSDSPHQSARPRFPFNAIEFLLALFRELKSATRIPRTKQESFDIVGGTVLFALLSYAQVMKEI